jgi:hypothetical protein
MKYLEGDVCIWQDMGFPVANDQSDFAGTRMEDFNFLSTPVAFK